MQFDLGDRVKDSITGFAGIVIARTEYLNGCARYQLQCETLDKDGKPQEWQSFDEMQLKLLKPHVATGQQVTGGPQKSEPSRQSNRDPKR